MHTISQAINFPFLAGPSSVVLYSLLTIPWLSHVPCWQEEPQQIVWQTWAVPVLTRGSLQGFLPVGYAAMLFLVSKKVQAPTRASPTAGPRGSCSGVWILKRLLKAAALPALGAQTGSHFPMCCLFSQNQAPLRS